MLPGLIPFIMWWIYHEDPMPLWNLGVVAAVVAVLTLYVVAHPQGRRRGREENWPRTCLTYGIPPFIVLALFPGQAEYAGVVLCVLAFGDSAAALGGRLFGKRPLPWNPRKTWMGSLCFMLLAAPIAILAYWGEARPAVSWSAAVICGTAGAVLGGVAESLPSRIDDNLRVSVAAAVGVVVAANLV
jgi:dolichol kinase